MFDFILTAVILQLWMGLLMAFALALSVALLRCFCIVEGPIGWAWWQWRDSIIQQRKAKD